MRTRKEVRDGSNGSADDRKTFDTKTIRLLLVTFISTGGAAAVINYITNPNIELQRRVEVVETLGSQQQLKLANIVGRNRLDEATLSQFIVSHKEETDLKKELLDHKLEDIEKLLVEISEKLDRD